MFSRKSAVVINKCCQDQCCDNCIDTEIQIISSFESKTTVDELINTEIQNIKPWFIPHIESLYKFEASKSTIYITILMCYLIDLSNDELAQFLRSVLWKIQQYNYPLKYTDIKLSRLVFDIAKRCAWELTGELDTNGVIEVCSKLKNEFQQQQQQQKPMFKKHKMLALQLYLNNDQLYKVKD